MAAKHGHGEMQASRFPTRDLDAESIGLAHHFIRPRKRQPFAHHHDQAEEIFVVLSGSGRMKLDDEIAEVGPLDAIRVSPEVARAFEAGDEGLEVLVFGPRRQGDATIIQEDFWGD